MRGLCPSLVQALLEAPDCRSFLQSFISQDKPASGAWTYSQLGRRAGFSSRAYVREVVLGKRALTPQAADRFAVAMRLDRDFREYFCILAHQNRTPASEDRLSKLRQRIQQTASGRSVEAGLSFAEKLLELKFVPRVYAALGPAGTGSTQEEIQARTNLPLAKLKPVLRRLKELNLILEDSGRLTATNNHLIESTLGKSENFKAVYLSGIEAARSRAKHSVDRAGELFLSSSFSVKKDDLPKLKAALRALLVDFVDRAERSDGDAVVNLVAALHL